MEEINIIFSKYDKKPLDSLFDSEIELNNFAITFSKDLSEIIEMISLITNDHIKLNYYNLNECTIVGSLIRIIKYYKEVISIYEQNKSEIINLFVRPLYESFITIKYLIINGEESQENFRLISYKARFDVLKKQEDFEGKDSLQFKRLLSKINAKLDLDEFTFSDLELENKKDYKKKWKLDGKSFRDINKEVDIDYFYSSTYGVGSDSIHGNWQEIFDYHLNKKENGYFGNLYYENCNYTNLVTLNNIIIQTVLEFLKWNNCMTKSIEIGMNNMFLTNLFIYKIGEEKYGEQIE